MSLAPDYNSIRVAAVTALKEAFPDSVVSAVEGWRGRAHLKIVSPVFDGKTEKRKQDLVWSVLREKLGSESQAVSLVTVYGMDEI